ncbi:hypothetical protein AB0J57_13675 [Streptomyces sp. NPDC049837]|uniref:HalD/BesD family halogenase n=1 Tax=Streptomyces sp. NPDC049837 TaxID=3155277 RepID=UPI00341C6D1E
MLRIPSPGIGARERFGDSGYVPLHGLLDPSLLSLLRQEALRLEKAGRRRDFTMECMDGSPRHLTTLGGQVIARQSALIPRLYADDAMVRLVSRLTGENIVTVADPVERHVLNILHRQGDTHGAHTDDYPYALVLFLEAPASTADGGLLEYVPGTRHLDDLRTPTARSVHHRPGDAYLLRSDTTAHRVTPLTRAGLRRTVLNFAYTTPDFRPRDTGSARELYT